MANATETQVTAPTRGDQVGLLDADGRLECRATVGGAGGELHVHGPALPGSGVRSVRWLDGHGVAWVRRAELLDEPAGGCRLDWRGPAEEARARRSARFGTDHELLIEPVRIDTSVELRGRTYRVRSLDVSAGGVRVTGLGAEPPDGAHVRMRVGMTGIVRTLRARIVRFDHSPFARWELGLEFEPRTDGERTAILNWRDSAAAL